MARGEPGRERDPRRRYGRRGWDGYHDAGGEKSEDELHRAKTPPPGSRPPHVPLTRLERPVHELDTCPDTESDAGHVSEKPDQAERGAHALFPRMTRSLAFACSRSSSAPLRCSSSSRSRLSVMSWLGVRPSRSNNFIALTAPPTATPVLETCQGF